MVHVKENGGIDLLGVVQMCLMMCGWIEVLSAVVRQAHRAWLMCVNELMCAVLSLTIVCGVWLWCTWLCERLYCWSFPSQIFEESFSCVCWSFPSHIIY